MTQQTRIRTQSNIYDGFFCENSGFQQKCFIIDVRLGSE